MATVREEGTVRTGFRTSTVTEETTGLRVQDPQDLTQAAGVGTFGPLWVEKIAAHATTGKIFTLNSPKCVVLDMWCVCTGSAGAADTVTLKNGSTAITDAVDMNVSDKVLVRADEFDDDEVSIAAGSTLDAVAASGAPADCYVLLALEN